MKPTPLVLQLLPNVANLELVDFGEYEIWNFDMTPEGYDQLVIDTNKGTVEFWNCDDGSVKLTKAMKVELVDITE